MINDLRPNEIYQTSLTFAQLCCRGNQSGIVVVPKSIKVPAPFLNIAMSDRNPPLHILIPRVLDGDYLSHVNLSLSLIPLPNSPAPSQPSTPNLAGCSSSFPPPPSSPPLLPSSPTFPRPPSGPGLPSLTYPYRECNLPHVSYRLHRPCTTSSRLTLHQSLVYARSPLQSVITRQRSAAQHIRCMMDVRCFKRQTMRVAPCTVLRSRTLRLHVDKVRFAVEVSVDLNR